MPFLLKLPITVSKLLPIVPLIIALMSILVTDTLSAFKGINNETFFCNKLYFLATFLCGNSNTLAISNA